MDVDDAFAHEGLFQIGDVARSCGVDRQTILFYERKGLLRPTAQNKSSGYRYYSVEAVSELMQILQLKDAELSLAEIKDFIRNGAPAAERVIASMEKKLAALLLGLEQTRAICVEKGDYTVAWTVMPAARCFVRESVCHGVDETMDVVYGAFREALTLGLPLRGAYRIYAEYPEETGGPVNLTEFPLRVCIPVDGEAGGADCVDMPTISGVAVCHRGAYTEIGAAYDALWRYVRENALTPAGPVREYYLESRRAYQDEADRYVTRLVLPVEERRRVSAYG